MKVQICISAISLASVNADWFYRPGFTFLVLAHPGSPRQNPESHKMVILVVVVGVVHSVSTKHLYVNDNCSAMASMAMNVDNALPTNAQNSQPVRQAMANKLNSLHTRYVFTTTTTTFVNGHFSRTTWVSRHQRSITILVKPISGFTGARDSEWRWHQLGDMQICTPLQTDNYASTPQVSFLQAGCPSCHPTNSIKALKESLY